MHVLPLITPRLNTGDDLASIFLKSFQFEDNDILVVSSKALARTEGRTVDLSLMQPTDHARELSKKCSQHPQFTEYVLQEVARMHGEVDYVSPYALLTSLRPQGLTEGRLLCPNAGVDQSNCESNTAIGWPLDPVGSILALQTILQKQLQKTDKNFHVSVILSDSCCTPARLGVTAFALVCIGIDPIESQVGMEDLFGKKMRVTHEARADQLATIANFVMGNTAQSCPAAVIRAHQLPSSSFTGWVPCIEEGNDLFDCHG